ncbi:hypothetical protein F5Y15DRAFT_429608 [Xylariaceae sp. FL0016]|nr:hypothetical protein F5Y15DRAFT_429608 [Xylariaceae sp. FL0016]
MEGAEKKYGVLMEASDIPDKCQLLPDQIRRLSDLPAHRKALIGMTKNEDEFRLCRPLKKSHWPDALELIKVLAADSANVAKKEQQLPHLDVQVGVAKVTSTDSNVNGKECFVFVLEYPESINATPFSGPILKHKTVMKRFKDSLRVMTLLGIHEESGPNLHRYYKLPHLILLVLKLEGDDDLYSPEWIDLPEFLPREGETGGDTLADEARKLIPANSKEYHVKKPTEPAGK